MAKTKTIDLIKGKQRFYFKYEDGEEGKLIDAIVEMVQRRDLDFDWFDAALVTNQISEHTSKELLKHLKEIK